ncbi:nuclease HARBI1 [Labeo rohita]|uniref:Nuclease HARBI1 n=1 Tax=Labeo rohita TaxID=84645 RepID=A0A498MM22_LABRO|nr:nuclease HARBI1 [Labeo rohita]
MAAQFRVYHRVMELSPCNAEKIVQATTILHNFIRWGHRNSPSTSGYADPGAALHAAGRMGSNTASREALAVREKYREYFNSPCGEVLWQYNQQPRTSPVEW